MHTDLSKELGELQRMVRELQARVARLEGGALPREAPAAATPDAPLAPVAAGGLFATLFSRMALVCFALVGALVLRVATQGGYLPNVTGTAVGLAYSALLLALPALLRRVGSPHAGAAAVLQYCAVVLAPLVILEMVHRIQVLPVGVASAVLLVVGLGGISIAATTGARGLAALSLVADLGGILLLGPSPEGASIRALSAFVLVIVSLWLAHRKTWPLLRPLALLPSGVTLCMAVLMTARRPEFPADVTLVLFSTVVGMWVAVAANHLLRRALLTSSESSWLALAGLSTTGVAIFYAPSLAPPSIAGLGFIGLAGMLHLARRKLAPKPALVSATIALALPAAAALFFVDPSGITLALVALLVWAISVALASELAAVTAALVALAAAVFSLGRGHLWALEGLEPLPMLAGVVLAAALFTHGCLASCHPRFRLATTAGRSLASLSLAAGFVVLFAVARATSRWLWGAADAHHLTTTAVLCVLALFALRMSGWLQSRTWLGLGIVGVTLLAGKVLFYDLFALAAPYALGAVVALGGAFVATSVTLRRLRPAGPAAPTG
ncbi:MAG: hypothetical protein HY903_07405 [Deltaproteobacteria bacterium]|nr:hypothetical protein [Deltaproteobacteria bacterium]